MPHTPTPEQQAIIHAAVNDSHSIMINAYAGCAKTSTLSMLMQARTAASCPGDALYIVFNVRNKKEAEKAGQFPPGMQVKTLNGLGHSAIGRALGRKLTVDDRKLGKLVTLVLRNAGTKDDGDLWPQVRELVTSAMQAGLVPEKYKHYKGLVPDEEATWKGLCEFTPNAVAIGLAREVLRQSVRMAFEGIISFDDQIYISTMFGGAFGQFGLVLVDEAQDLSPLQHLMVARSARDRIIAVGDQMQAIYGWRGASTSSMQDIRKLRSEWIDLPLRMTFRCPKNIVHRQRHHAVGFLAHESNEKGFFFNFFHPDDTKESNAWSYGDISDTDAWKVPDNASVAILCRNNAPLLSLAFKLIRDGVSCVMAGRDIGKGLQALAKKLLPDPATPRKDCISTIRQWMDNETILAPEKEESISDRGECLLAVMGQPAVQTAGQLSAALATLFARETGKVTLSSIHRAKGLEWDIVIHLDPWRIPSKRAVKHGNPEELAQERNLQYVCETRTRRVLIEANLEDYGETNKSNNVRLAAVLPDCPQ